MAPRPKEQRRQRLPRWQQEQDSLDASKRSRSSGTSSSSSSSTESSPLLGRPLTKARALGTPASTAAVDAASSSTTDDDTDRPSKCLEQRPRTRRIRTLCAVAGLFGLGLLLLLLLLLLFSVSPRDGNNSNYRNAPSTTDSSSSAAANTPPQPTLPFTTTTLPFTVHTRRRHNNNCPRHFQNPKPGTTAVGDVASTTRGGNDDDNEDDSFAARTDENLVFCESFDDDSHNNEEEEGKGESSRLWHADHTLFGEGNGGFAYYTPENVVTRDGLLHIRPGLFTDLGLIPTRQKDKHGSGTSTTVVMVPAEQVMTGNCQPFPACATLDLTLLPNNNNCTIADFDGCQRIGTPLVTLNPVTSGRISTQGNFAMLYGRVEARIRLPQGDWLWPALWFMPTNESKYGRGWPDSGEIDLLESKGNNPNVNGRWGGGRNMFSSCLHYNGNSWWKTRNSLLAMDILQACRNGTVPLSECDWSTDFFTIGLYWSPTRMYAYVLRENEIAFGVVEEEEIKLWEVDATRGFGPDDYPLGSNFPPFFKEESTPNESPQGPYTESSNKNAPFDQPFYLILNLSVGGEGNGCLDPGYWGPDSVWCLQRDPNNPQEAARTVFWKNKDLWYPSWQEAKEKGRDSFAVDWIKVWQ